MSTASACSNSGSRINATTHGESTIATNANAIIKSPISILL